ncbi:MAG: hypothetical protein ACFB20_07395 [Opitutales bacterium]
MKMRKVFPLIAAALGLAITTHAQSMTKGDILVIVSQGEVMASDSATGVSMALKVGDVLQEGFTVSTGGNSAASLAFANGALVNLNERTVMEIRRFRMVASDVAFDGFSGLVAEPTQSDTRLYLETGQLVGETRPLDEQSAYMIQAEVGTLRIVGTSWVFGASLEQVSAAIIDGMGTLINNLNGSSQSISAGMQLFIQQDASGAFVFSGLEQIDPAARQAFIDQINQAFALGGPALDGGVPADDAGGAAPAGPGAGLGGGGFSAAPAVDTSLLTPTPTEAP